MSKYATFFPDEQIVFEQEGFWLKSLLNVKTGTVVLTDKRVAFIERKVVVGGALAHTADLALGVSRPKLKVDVPIAEMAEYKIGNRKMDIIVSAKAGESFKLRGVDAAAWVAKIGELAR
jgi:hypothetical protein